MRRIVVIAFLTLIMAGVSFAIVKLPSTTIKINTTIVENITANETNKTIQPVVKPIPSVADMPVKPPKNESNASGPIDCIACGSKNFTKIPIYDVLGPQSCLENETAYLHHSPYYGHYQNFEEPDYLENAHEDCDLLGKDQEIMQDLDAKLAIIDQMEAEINAVEGESSDLVERGKEAVRCLRVAQHELTVAGSNPSFSSTTILGGGYLSGGMFNYVVTQLQNFHYAYEDVHTGYNHSEASMENLLNITLGLEDMCRNHGCAFPEDKEYYEDLLENEAYEASFYANKTKLFIDDARDFAQSYHDLKGSIDRDECMDFFGQAVQYAPWMDLSYENFSQNESPRNIIAPVKLAKNFSGVRNVTLVGGPKPKYVIRSLEKKKLLWMFEVQVETKTEVNARNGRIINEEKPWWSFLLTN